MNKNLKDLLDSLLKAESMTKDQWIDSHIDNPGSEYMPQDVFIQGLKELIIRELTRVASKRKAA